MDFLQAEMDVIDQKADALIEPFKVEYELLQTIPGVKQKAAKIIIAEIGTDMSVFPSSPAPGFMGWIMSGQHESAGKKKAHA